jgi:hypothetical protein
MNNEFSETTFDRNKYLRKDTAPIKSPSLDSGLDSDKFEYPEWPFDKSKYARKYEPGIERHLTRTASRVGETLGGLPGNTIQFIKFMGELLPEEPEFLKREPNFIQKFGKKALDTVPTSEDLKNISKEYFGLWTSPQDETEELGDEAVETLTNLMNPIARATGWLKGIAASVFGVGAKKLAKEYGAPEWGQEAAKLGTTLGISMFDPKGARNFTSNLYHKAEAAIPDTVTVPGQKVLNDLTKFKENLSKGGGKHAKSSSPVIDWADRVIEHINDNNGRLNVKEGQAFVRNINEAMGDPENLQRAKKLFPVLKDSVREGMSQVETTYPEYWKLLRSADNAHAAIEQGSKLGYKINEAIRKSPLKSDLGLIMASYAYTPGLTAAYVGSRGLIEGMDILSQISKSSALRGHYLDVLKKASSNNQFELMKSLKKFDKEALKEEKTKSQSQKQNSQKYMQKK